MENFLGINKENWKVIGHFATLFALVLIGVWAIVCIGNSYLYGWVIPALYNAVLTFFLARHFYRKWFREN